MSYVADRKDLHSRVRARIRRWACQQLDWTDQDLEECAQGFGGSYEELSAEQFRALYNGLGELVRFKAWMKKKESHPDACPGRRDSAE